MESLPMDRTISPTFSRHLSSPSHNENQRPRAVSALSHDSKRSRRSSGSRNKLDLTETHDEKKKLHTKADPSLAINEAQPAAVALEESTLENIAEVQHRDRFGNVIMDPDRSNPTRPRLERPLDTIRAFERAAEATHSGRRSTYSGRPGSQVGYDPSQSRRSSYFGGNSNVGNYNQQYRSRPGVRQSYYAGNGWQRPESVAEHGAGPTYNNNRAMMMRNGMNGGYGHNPDNSISSAGNSFDPSGSEGMANGSTQPSSQNSSIEHFQQRKFDDHPYQSQNNHYSPNGDYSPVSPQYSQNDLQNYSADDPYNRNANLSNGNMNGYNSHNNPSPTRAPAPPSKVGPIKLGNSSAQEISQDSYLSLKQAPSQRKSWFKRRFSKQKEEF